MHTSPILQSECMSFDHSYVQAPIEIFMNSRHPFGLLNSYVFEDYEWTKKSGDFSRFNTKWIPARVPLTALLSGALYATRILDLPHLSLFD
jgi:hypothetical protein